MARPACPGCDAALGELHRADCPVLKRQAPEPAPFYGYVVELASNEVVGVFPSLGHLAAWLKANGKLNAASYRVTQVRMVNRWC